MSFNNSKKKLIDSECCICLDSFEIDTTVSILEYDHLFNTQCID